MKSKGRADMRRSTALSMFNPAASRGTVDTGGRRRRRRTAVTSLLAVAMVAAGCGSSKPSSANAGTTPATSASSSSGSTGSSGSPNSSKPFVIGAVMSETGSFSAVDIGELDGLKVGVDEVNAAGGIMGRKVVLDVVNDNSNANQEILAVEKLESKGNIDLLVPDPISPLSLASLPYETQNKILSMTGSSTPALGDPSKYPYNFILGELTSKRVPAVADAIKQFSKGDTKVGLLYSTTTAQTAFGTAFAAFAPSHGLSISKQLTVNGAASDMTPQLEALRSAGANVVVFDSEINGSLHVLMTGMEQLGWTAPVYVPPEAVEGSLNTQIPSAVASQFHAVLERVEVRPANGSTPPALANYIKALSAYGPIESVMISLTQTDLAWIAKWGYETAQKQYGNTSGPTVTKVLETITNGSFPSSYDKVWVPNPGFTSKYHDTQQFNYSNFFGVVGASPLVNGQYTGQYYSVPEDA